ncbi:MAG: DnaD domain protein [Erysipelotrichaceae bacterium]|nr:DnaD domain protein [Erysipelotrichaceae bacterium]MBR6232572.1 DnaD domain protein [Erysipelotrichaceae bacterium]
MLGKDLYKIEVNTELSNERLRSLVFFYGPLIGKEALVMYEYLVLRGNQTAFEEINSLLMNLNLSIDDFEFYCIKLNEYRLLKTLKQDNRYIFVFNDPLEVKQFIKDDILVRDFILKTSGEYYRELTSDIYMESDHAGFEDVSQTLSLDTLQDWKAEDESYLKKKEVRRYEFPTMFDVNVFLKDISSNLLPMRFRTPENMKELATLADLYNISYDKMRTYLPRVARTDTNEFDLKELRYLCMNAKSEYKKIDGDPYDTPCLNFLMSLQGGKEVTDYDKKIIYRLSQRYHLSVPVINVLLEHGLKNCNNSLIENYLYPIASDLHRNDILTSAQALERLNRPYEKKNRREEKLPVYDTSVNETMSASQEEELLRLMGKK